MVLSLGGFHEKGGDGNSKVRNTHVLLGRDGSVVGKYSKAHLFDVDIPGGARLKESGRAGTREKERAVHRCSSRGSD